MYQFFEVSLIHKIFSITYNLSIGGSFNLNDLWNKYKNIVLYPSAELSSVDKTPELTASTKISLVSHAITFQLLWTF